MEPLYDDYLEDGFHRALLGLKEDVAQEVGIDRAVPLIASWAGRKPSTVYAWIEKGILPSNPADLPRLVINSARAGYPRLLTWLSGGAFRVADAHPVFTNNSLNDEARRDQIVWGRLRLAEEANEAEAIIEGGRELISIGEHVVAEGQNMLTSRARVSPGKNGIRVMNGTTAP